ncbi:terminase small subunit [Escherichia coli]|uniref:terminase small subunit n=1 Tax=Escherichia coli TaxID=562 RepID=UPI003CC91A40
MKNEKLRKGSNLRAASESDLQPGTRLRTLPTDEAQADAQELKNAREEGLVLETGYLPTSFMMDKVVRYTAAVLARWFI